MRQALVSVVIPAFNAAGTIDATLRSALGQTHAALEVIVVDDGSSDDTPARVRAHAAGDARVRLIVQPNGGVARARNAGIAAANGHFVAPLDADDLWHPEKIARQLAALEAAGPEAGLAYNWFRRIDEADRVLPASPHPLVEGRVLHRHIDWNFVSNGSTPLVRADIARAIGFDPALHDAGNQGCEDYLFQMRVAIRHRFVCVPAFLTGYRRSASAMSAGTERMIRSHLQAYALLSGEVDAPARALIRRRRAALMVELARSRLGDRAFGSAAADLLRAVATHPASAGAAAWNEAQARMHRPGAITPGRRFEDYGAEERDGAWRTKRSPRWLAHLAEMDAR